MHVYQLIKQVQNKYRGLCVRLSEKTGQSDEWFRSHGYKPKTLDAFGNGNKCAEVENYLAFLELYESGAKGAGLMLNQLINAEAKCRLSDSSPDCTDRELRRSGLKEATELINAIDKQDLESASVSDLELIISELADLHEWTHRLEKHISREFQKREIKDVYFTNGTAKHGSKSVNLR